MGGGGGGVRTKFSVQLWSQAEQNSRTVPEGELECGPAQPNLFSSILYHI